MTVTDRGLQLDQKHFDAAWEARELARESLHHAADAAGGGNATARALRRGADAMAETLAPGTEAVAIGRIDDEDEITYIGKNQIFNADRDQLVVSWKAKAAEPFYKASIVNPMGLLKKRTFTTTGNKIKSFEDAVFAELARRVDELTQRERADISDALLDDLARTRTSEMQDIVQTIHHSQYELIELPRERLLVIQGGPGTGKTAVVLHRISWLLYNHPEIKAPDVLVIGPNAAFTQYIRKVLPGLGDSDVQHLSLGQLGPTASTNRPESLETGGLKGQLRIADLLGRSLVQRVRVPNEAIEVETSAGMRLLTKQVISEAVKNLLPAPGQPFDGSFATARIKLRVRLEDAIQATPGKPEAAPRSMEAVLDRVWPSTGAARFLQELLGSRDRLIQAAGDEFTAGDIDRLHRQAANNLGTEQWSDADVALIDELDWIINGSQASAGVYEHIVVDEAQDLSPMQLRSLARRSGTGEFTLSGDIAQATGPWGRNNWDDIVEALAVNGVEHEVRTLQYGYRVPTEVYAVAQPLLAHIAPDLDPPTVIRSIGQAPTLRETDSGGVLAGAIAEAQQYAGMGHFVGVICAAEAIDGLAAAFAAAKVSFSTVSSGQLGKSINLMTALESKGLEFDAVVVVEPAAIALGGGAGLRALYIALTRTTKYLSVAYSKALSEIGLHLNQSELTELERPKTLGDGDHMPPKPRGAARHREVLPDRVQKAVHTYAEGLAEEVAATFLPNAHPALLESLASLLGVDLGISGPDEE